MRRPPGPDHERHGDGTSDRRGPAIHRHDGPCPTRRAPPTLTRCAATRSVEGTEECDDGNQVDGDGCEANCTNTPECGNNLVDVGEVCDDGNTMDGDECSADCTMATIPGECGDGVVQAPELCDDGNVADGDGCQADCTPTPADCGNGILEAGEECDDGNFVNGGPDDFCKNDCTSYNPPSCQAPALNLYKVCDDQIDLADKTDKTVAHKAMGICDDLGTNSVLITTSSSKRRTTRRGRSPAGSARTCSTPTWTRTPRTRCCTAPREGDAMLLLSTGRIKAPNGEGIVIENVASQVGNNDNGNPDMPNTMPAPLSDEVGSDNGNGGTPFMMCDGVNDCSDTLSAQWNIVPNPNPDDKLFFKFKTKVPPGTFGYRFDFVFCSSEYPEYVGTKFNDLLIAWQVDPSPGPGVHRQRDVRAGPERPDKGLPLTITALDGYFAVRASAIRSRSWRAPGSRTTRAPTGSPRRAACSRRPTSRSHSSSRTWATRTWRRWRSSTTSAGTARAACRARSTTAASRVRADRPAARPLTDRSSRPSRRVAEGRAAATRRGCASPICIGCTRRVRATVRVHRAVSMHRACAWRVAVRACGETATRLEMPMTDIRTMQRLLYLGLCSAAFVACGDDGTEPPPRVTRRARARAPTPNPTATRAPRGTRTRTTIRRPRATRARSGRPGCPTRP
jgi:cysteine-rich repeat protein